MAPDQQVKDGTKKKQGFELLKAYISARQLFLKKLEAEGFEEGNIKSPTPLIDRMKDFIDNNIQDKETKNFYLEEFRSLLELRWAAIEAYKPLLWSFLKGKKYDPNDDLNNGVITYMLLALEKAIDKADSADTSYIRQYLAGSWPGALNNGGWREHPSEFTDGYADDPYTQRTVDPSNTPEEDLLEKNDKLSAKKIIERMKQDASAADDIETVEELTRMLQEIETKNRCSMPRNNRIAGRLRAYALANGAHRLLWG